jgi:hypothetical protein
MSLEYSFAHMFVNATPVISQATGPCINLHLLFLSLHHMFIGQIPHQFSGIQSSWIGRQGFLFCFLIGNKCISSDSLEGILDTN